MSEKTPVNLYVNLQHLHTVVSTAQCVNLISNTGIIPMSSDVRLVTDTTERYSVKAAPHSASNGATNAGLTHTGWSHKTKYWTCRNKNVQNL